jgi:glycosyltransferase involved in cell wall biosynthesis
VKSVIHVNDKITIAGGAEIYISQIQPLLRASGWSSEWLAIKREGRRMRVESNLPSHQWEGNMEKFPASNVGKIMRKGVIHLHSIADPQVVRVLLEMAPVIRKMADPRVFCPGQGKFWASDEVQCPLPMGSHCLFHAYTKRCCPRNPTKLLAAMRNATFESKIASKLYFRLLANSNWTREEAIKAGISPAKISLLHNFTLKTPQASEAPDDCRVVFAGRLSHSKGVHHLLHAFAKTALQLPRARLDILGDGINGAEFRSLAGELNLGERVVFHGWASRETIDHFLSKASLVAFPSIYPEAFGITGIEAMMRGKAVVAYDVGGIGDWLSHRKTGILVAAKNIDQLSAGMTELLDDAEKRTQYGKDARKAALEKFGPESHIEKLIALYECALEENQHSI